MASYFIFTFGTLTHFSSSKYTKSYCHLKGISMLKLKTIQLYSIHFPQLKTTKKRAKTILFAMLLLLTSFMALSYIFTQGINDIAKTQLQAIQRGNLSRAYDLTSKNFQQSISFAYFEEAVNKLSVLKDFKNLAFTDQKIHNNHAYLKGTLETLAGKKIFIEYHLVKENQEWKIQALSLFPTDQSIKPFEFVV